MKNYPVSQFTDPRIRREVEAAQRQANADDRRRKKLEEELARIEAAEAEQARRKAEEEARAAAEAQRRQEAAQAQERAAAAVRGELEALDAEFADMEKRMQRLQADAEELARRRAAPDFDQVAERVERNRWMAARLAGMEPDALAAYLPPRKSAPMFPVAGLAALHHSVRADVVKRHLEEQLNGVNLSRLAPRQVESLKKTYTENVLTAISNIGQVGRNAGNKAQADALRAVDANARELGIVPIIDPTA